VRAVRLTELVICLRDGLDIDSGLFMEKIKLTSGMLYNLAFKV
jgi:hypothetical protein